MYHRGCFREGSNIDLNFITCEDKIVITEKIQSYVLHWYHTYLLHPGMDGTEAMICQHFYWPNIIDAVRKEVTNCDTFQHKKRSNREYVKLPAKLDEEIPWNKNCIDLIGTYITQHKENK